MELSQIRPISDFAGKRSASSQPEFSNTQIGEEGLWIDGFPKTAHIKFISCYFLFLNYGTEFPGYFC